MSNCMFGLWRTCLVLWERSTCHLIERGATEYMESTKQDSIEH